MPSFKKNTQSWPQDVGVIGIEVYFPSQYVCQKELEQFDGVSQGKYTIGLGQSKMGFCSDCEDINSLCLTALSKLMDKTQVGYSNIGRLEVGTETIIDKSKSVKSVLMQLFEESGNFDVEGVDSTNACYGATAALFNSINWVESSAWDGRYAVVVAGDIAVYAKGAARPTGGAGAVAMLVGPNAPLMVERGVRSSYMKHVYDFYKPDLSSEYPTVDGKLSIECYMTALDSCYQTYLRKAAENKFCSDLPSCLDDFDAVAFHSPFCKLVQKSFARLVLNDFCKCPSSNVKQRYPGMEKFREKTLSETYFDKEVEKAFVTFSKDLFEAKTKPSLMLASEVGNSYTPSLYGGIASILANSTSESLAGKRIGLFSYGSGLAATMFSIKVSDDCGPHSGLHKMVGAASDIHSRLNARVKVGPSIFTNMMNIREANHHKAPYTPCGDVSSLFPGTFYLTRIDELHRRKYDRVPSSPIDKFNPGNASSVSLPFKKETPISPFHSTSNGHSNGLSGVEVLSG